MTKGVTLYPELMSRLSAAEEDTDVVLAAADFGSALLPVTDFDGLVLNKHSARVVTSCGVDDAPFECVDFVLAHYCCALKDGYQQVGLWMLHLLFSGRPWAGLRLTRTNSNLAHLYVEVDRPVPRDPFLTQSSHAQYDSYSYYYRAISRHPFATPPMGDEGRIAPEDRPMFRFGWSDQAALNRAKPEEADQLILTVSPEGLCAFAVMLLDFGAAWQERDEINMEPPFVGFAATQPLSLEARMWLPGSMVFRCDELDRLHFEPHGT